MQNCAGVEQRVSAAIAINDSLRNRIFSALHRSITPDVVIFCGACDGLERRGAICQTGAKYF